MALPYRWRMFEQGVMGLVNRADKLLSALPFGQPPH